MSAMSTFEERNLARARGDYKHGRCQTTLDRLPKPMLQHLHATWLGTHEGLDKPAIVSALWQKFSTGEMAAAFWRDVRLVWDQIERIKADVGTRRPRP